jgi:tripartite-type tricarboxylate transporter receptor subunit TctC
MPSLSRRSFIALGVAPAIVPSLARGQTTLPDKGVRMLVGFSTGGGTDVLARVVAQRLERRIGRHVTVENRPGGTGAVVGELLKKAPPDGTLLGFIPSTTLASKLSVKSFPFDPVKDVMPVSLIGTFQMAIAATRKIDVTTFGEYLQWLKGDEPERRRLGTASTDTFLQLFGMLLGREAGVQIENVAYRGAGPLMNDLQDGRIPAGFSGVPSLLPQHRGGRLRILATSGQKRVGVAPNLPTALELGHPSLELDEWYGFFVSPSTSDALVAEWNRQIRAELAQPETVAELTALSLDVETSTPEELAARVTKNLDQWSQRMALFAMKPVN